MARTDAEWQQDIVSAIAASPAIVRSVLYSIAVMGEAAKNIGPAFKEAHPDIPWRAIAGIRDKIVHEYFRTNTRRIWDVVADDIDRLEAALTRHGPRSI